MSTTKIYALDGSLMTVAATYDAALEAAAWSYGKTINDADSVESLDDGGDPIEFVVVDNKIVGTLGRPMVTKQAAMQAAE